MEGSYPEAHDACDPRGKATSGLSSPGKRGVLEYHLRYITTRSGSRRPNGPKLRQTGP